MRRRILEQPVDILTKEETLYLIKASLINPKQFKIITLNSEMIVNALSDFEFQASINNADLLVPDSIGIVWALKLLNPGQYTGLKRLPGIELAESILQVANELNKTIAIFGGTREILEKATLVFNKKYPDVKIIKTVDGFQDKKNDEKIAEEISLTNPDIIFVALGSPRQDIWINKYANLFPHSLMIGIGGSLEVWSGKKARASEWIRNLHLEWFFRVLTDPKRIPRVLKSLPRFLWMVLKAKLVSNHQLRC